MQYDVVIVGAGICGLTAAYKLHQAGFSVLVIESDSRVGGKIQTSQIEGFLVEHGPNSFPSKADALLSLCQELHLDPLPASGHAKKRYLYYPDRLNPLPSGPLSFLGTPLLSPLGKLRLLKEPWQCSEKRKNGEEESVASFTERRLGREVLEKLIGPFLTGIYAGNPEALSLQAVFPSLAGFEQEDGSIASGAWKLLRQQKSKKNSRGKASYQLLSFKEGMRALPEALAKEIPKERLQLDTKLEDIQRGSTGFKLLLSGGKSLETRSLLLATPTESAACLLAPLSEEISGLLNEIEYTPLAVVHLGIQRHQIRHALDGFGFLVPRISGIPLLGSIWASSLFPSRAPQGQILLTSMIGGAFHPEIVTWDEEQLVRQVSEDLSQIFKVSPVVLTPSFSKVFCYNRAIPQFNLGHLGRVNQIERLLAEIPGLFLTGNYLQGVSLNDCVQHAISSAQKLEKFLKQPLVHSFSKC